MSKKNIIALIFLTFFIILVLNLVVFRYYLEVTWALWILCVIGFLIYLSTKKKPDQVKKEDFLDFSCGFGKGKMDFVIPVKNYFGEMRQNDIEITKSENEIIEEALNNPISSPKLSDILEPGKSIVIVTSDITRPMPSKRVLPHILNEIEKANCSLDDVTIVFGLGSHRKHSEEEMKYIVGEDVYSKVKCVDSDPSECRHLGTTSRGTPVDIFSVVADSDYRICLGNIEYHYFAGYSGGAKAIMPGVSTREAIQANHSAMVKAEAKAGAIENNPVRQDIDEVADKFVKIDFIFNVVLNEKKEIIYAVSGHYIDAHRAGCKFLDKLYKVEIEHRADIVIATPGGYPKDINLYQAQKALDNAKHAVKDGGIIILIAACTEGLGEKVFERWMTNAESPEGLISDIQDHFELGGHKAAAIALVKERASIYLVSEMEDDFVRSLFMEPYKNVNTALAAAIKAQGPNSEVLFMPYAGSTLPVAIN